MGATGQVTDSTWGDAGPVGAAGVAGTPSGAAGAAIGGAGTAVGGAGTAVGGAGTAVGGARAADLARAQASGPPAATDALAGAAAPFYKAMPATSGFAVQPLAVAPAGRGYAVGGPKNAVGTATATAAITTAATAVARTALTAGARPATRTTAAQAAASAGKASASELAFLDDKGISIEDKLYRFMALMCQKQDQELVEAMKGFGEKKAAAAKAKASDSGGGGGGGLLGFIGDALGGLARTVVGGVETVAKDLGGPLLAAGATAVGLPFLAPVALKIGGDLGAGLVDAAADAVGLGGKSGSSSAGDGGGTATAPADPEAFDEKLEMLQLQQLVDKQQAMFTALSGAMKAMHDTQLAIANNIR